VAARSGDRPDYSCSFIRSINLRFPWRLSRQCAPAIAGAASSATMACVRVRVAPAVIASVGFVALVVNFAGGIEGRLLRRRLVGVRMDLAALGVGCTRLSGSVARAAARGLGAPISASPLKASER
jgi:hypothetical protein